MAANRTARQQRADDTRARLFAAATELFATRGYHETTVDAIVKRAGVAKGTFFVHFATKDAVIVDLVRMQTSAARHARASALADGGPLAGLRAAAITLGEQAGYSRELSRAVLEAALENADVSGDADQMFGEVLADMIADAAAARAAGVLHETRDPVLVARALMASYLGAALHFCTSRKSGPLLEILAPLVDANIQGFMNPEVSHAPSPRTRVRGGRRRRLHQK